MAFSKTEIDEIVETTIPFPFFTRDDDGEIVEACMIIDMEGSDINKMPMTITLERENEFSVTNAIYQLVQSDKEFKRNRNTPDAECN